MRRILYVFTIVVLLLMSLPTPAHALTANLTVDGEGARYGGWSPFVYQTPRGVFGGTWNNLNINDDDGSVALGASTGTYAFWTFTSVSVTSITSVTAYARLCSPALGTGVNGWICPYIGGTYYGASGFYDYDTMDGAYHNYSRTWTTNPATGLAWTASDVSNADFGFVSGPPTAAPWITYMYIEVTYSGMPPSVTTSAITGIGVTSATLNGEITLLNGASVRSEGFVWDTVSHTPLASTNVTPGNGYANWWYQNGTYGVGSFSRTVTGLTLGTTYYYRACANNTYGWNYGSQLSFKTVGYPSVATTPATYISPTGAQLNASVTNSNEQACDVRFGYGTTSQAATLAGFNAYDARTAWVNNTYTTGQLPYAVITGLVLGTTYYFNVQIANDAGIRYGVERTFTTTTGLLPPTNFVAIPTYNTITLSWVKDPSTPQTEIRYSTSTYPNTTADGTLLYLGVLSSTTHTGLTSGTNYYYSAFGMGSGVYTTDKVTVLGTTAAGATPTALTPPTASSSAWVAMPSELGLSGLPFYPYLNWAFDVYELPRATGWVIIYLLMCIFIGMLIYMKAPSNNLLMTGIGIGVLLSVGSLFTPPLIPIWATFVFIIIFATIAWVVNRY